MLGLKLNHVSKRGHRSQQLWFRINGFLPSMRKHFNYLLHLTIEKWLKMQIYFHIISSMPSMLWDSDVNSPFLSTAAMILDISPEMTMQIQYNPLHDNVMTCINGLVQDCSISSVLARKILQSRTKPSVYGSSHEGVVMLLRGFASIQKCCGIHLR